MSSQSNTIHCIKPRILQQLFLDTISPSSHFTITIFLGTAQRLSLLIVRSKGWREGPDSLVNRIANIEKIPVVSALHCKLFFRHVSVRCGVVVVRGCWALFRGGVVVLCQVFPPLRCEFILSEILRDIEKCRRDIKGVKKSFICA